MPASDEPANPDLYCDEDAEPDERREVWTYAGARWDGKLHHAWWDGSELLHYRKRLVTVSVGGQAELSVRRSDDRIAVMTDRSSPTARWPPGSTTRSWSTSEPPPTSPPWPNATNSPCSAKRSASIPWTSSCCRCSNSRCT